MTNTHENNSRSRTLNLFQKSPRYFPTFRTQWFVLPHSRDPPCNRTTPPPAAPPGGSQQLVAQACTVDIPHRPSPPPPTPPQLWRAPSVTVRLLLSSQPAHFDSFLRCLEVRKRRVPPSLHFVYCKRLHVSAASAPGCSRLVIYHRAAADALASSSSPFLHLRY